MRDMSWMQMSSSSRGMRRGNVGEDSGQRHARLVRRGRRREPLHLVASLRGRESGLRGPWAFAAEVHQLVTPNATVVNVEVPAGFLRKFSPDGRWLLGFGAQQASALVYEYRGVAAAQALLAAPSPVLIAQDEEQGSPELRAALFHSLFRLRVQVALTPATGNLHLNRESSLFSQDSRHVILAAATSAGAGPVGLDPIPAVGDWYRNPESLSPSPLLGLEDVQVYVVRLDSGRLCHRLKFPCDKILLSHNHGLSLHGQTLAILSLQHQTIHLYRLDEESGALVELQELGTFLFDSDELFLRNCLAQAAEKFARGVHTGLKQRLLSFFFRETLSRHGGCPRRAGRELAELYRRWGWLERLKMLRASLLDSERLLIRWAPEEQLKREPTSGTTASAFLLAVFSLRKAHFEAVWDSGSADLELLYRRDPNALRQPDCARPLPVCLGCEGGGGSGGSGGPGAAAGRASTVEERRRLLGQLPFPSQSFASSPWLDTRLFSFDEKLVSALERPRKSGDCAVRFFCRWEGRLAFQLQPGAAFRGPAAPTKDHRALVAFIHHPHDPLIISVQRRNRQPEPRYVVNFHLRSAAAANSL